MKLSKILLTTSLVAAVTGPALAQSRPFSAIDTNDDGTLSQSELESVFGSNAAARMIERRDRDGDGALDRREARRSNDDEDDERDDDERDDDERDDDEHDDDEHDDEENDDDEHDDDENDEDDSDESSDEDDSDENDEEDDD